MASFGSVIQVAPFRQAGVHTNGKALTRFFCLVCAKPFNEYYSFSKWYFKFKVFQMVTIRHKA